MLAKKTGLGAYSPNHQAGRLGGKKHTCSWSRSFQVFFIHQAAGRGKKEISHLKEFTLAIGKRVGESEMGLALGSVQSPQTQCVKKQPTLLEFDGTWLK